MKILLIEDEPSLRESVRESLAAERYVVETAGSLCEAMAKVGVYAYDCIVLDLMLPDGNGLEVVRKLKSNERSEGVIILSARDSVDDRIEGLELGADDYLPKPFHLSELHARIRSIMRRKHGDGGATVRLGNVAVDRTAMSISVDGERLEIRRKEYEILYYLITRKGYITPKEVLAEAVWGDYIDQSDNFDFIYTHIKNLKRKLQQAGATIEIRSVYGMGYKMEEKE